MIERDMRRPRGGSDGDAAGGSCTRRIDAQALFGSEGQAPLNRQTQLNANVVSRLRKSRPHWTLVEGDALSAAATK